MEKWQAQEIIKAGFKQNPWEIDKKYYEIYKIMKEIHSVGRTFLASFKDPATQQPCVLKYFYYGDYEHELQMMLCAGDCSVHLLGRVWVEDRASQEWKVSGFIMPLLRPLAPGVNTGGITPARIRLSNPEKKSAIFKFRDKLKLLHHYGIIHGDIKPSNALLTATEDILFCDFSEAEHMPCNHPPKRVSTQYSSPQRCINPALPLSTYDDIYALGVSAWEIWTERTPYEDIKDIKDIEDIESVIAKGVKPDLSLVTDSQIKTLILECWAGRI